MKSRTHCDVYEDVGKKITLKKNQSLGRDSSEMRCPDAFFRSYLLCASWSNSVLCFGKTPLKLTDVVADSRCNIVSTDTG